MFKATNQNTSKANANRAGLFQQGATAGAFVQPKLNVGKPGDKYAVSYTHLTLPTTPYV